jgi:hypothetical protein
MNDDPELDPEQERQLRALLADLGTSSEASTMPPEVADRLEATLAELVAERPGNQPRATVVPLRRRWVPRATAAAAAVIVIGAGGVAAANLLDGNSASKDNATAGSSSSDAGGATSQESLGDTATDAPKTPPAARPSGLPLRLPRVTAASFDTDVERLLRRRDAASGDTSARQKDRTSLQQYAGSCPGPAERGRSSTTPVLYDDTRAALLIHPAQGGDQLVEAWTCGGDRLLDSAVVPAAAAPGLASPSPSP